MHEYNVGPGEEPTNFRPEPALSVKVYPTDIGGPPWYYAVSPQYPGLKCYGLDPTEAVEFLLREGRRQAVTRKRRQGE